MRPDEFYHQHRELAIELALTMRRARRQIRREARERRREQRGTQPPRRALLWLGIADVVFVVLHLCGAGGVWQGLAVAGIAAAGLCALTGTLKRQRRARSTASRREVPRG